MKNPVAILPRNVTHLPTDEKERTEYVPFDTESFLFVSKSRLEFSPKWNSTIFPQTNCVFHQGSRY